MRVMRQSNIRCKLFYASLIFSFLFVSWVYFHRRARREAESYSAAAEKYAILENKMRFVELQYQKKQEQILEIQECLERSSDKGHPTEKNLVYEKIMAHLKNISESSPFVKPVEEPEPLLTSLSYTTMPHLLRHPKSRSPAFQILSPRQPTSIDVVIGVPTVKRDKEDYLPETIRSLIDGMTPEQRKKNLIVISIGEGTDLDYVTELSFKLNLLFKEEFGQLIEVISPSKYWYPEWSEIPPTLGDSETRAHWRTKQNLDAIFLMSYAQGKGAYYLMLEDDVVAKPGYMTAIMKYVVRQSIDNHNWFLINFSTEGGIGKLFRMEDLSFFSAYVQVFYKYMPIDWLIELYLAGRVCGIDKSSVIVEILHDPLRNETDLNLFTKDEEKVCGERKGRIRPTYKEILFEHAGLFSSLKGKIQKVKPSLRKSKQIPLFFPHKNPPIDYLSTDIECAGDHTLLRAYNGLDYFWGVKTKYNDTIEFWFNPPLNLEKFFFRSGSPVIKTNVLHEGVVEVLPDKEEVFRFVVKFDEFGNAEGEILPSGNPVTAIRIRLLEKKITDIILSEIELLPVLTRNVNEAILADAD